MDDIYRGIKDSASHTAFIIFAYHSRTIRKYVYLINWRSIFWNQLKEYGIRVITILCHPPWFKIKPVMRPIRHNLRSVSMAFSRVIRYARPRACTYARACVYLQHPRESRESRKRVRAKVRNESAIFTRATPDFAGECSPDQIPILNCLSPPDSLAVDTLLIDLIRVVSRTVMYM